MGPQEATPRPLILSGLTIAFHGSLLNPGPLPLLPLRRHRTSTSVMGTLMQVKATARYGG